MKLQEIFTYLATGELAQVFLAEADGRDIIAPEHQIAMTQSIQLGLLALYKRFELKTGQVTIKTLTERTSYPLRSKYSITKGNAGESKYIQDSIQSPYRDDILKIERVTTLDGFEVPLNSRHERFSLYTPVVDTLTFPYQVVVNHPELPESMRTNTFIVHYRANHPNLIHPIMGVDPDRIEVELPQSHLQALLYYVASRKTNPIGIVQEFHAGNSWYQKYELECKQLENEGMGFNVDLTHQRFRKNGWA